MAWRTLLLVVLLHGAAANDGTGVGYVADEVNLAEEEEEVFLDNDPSLVEVDPVEDDLEEERKHEKEIEALIFSVPDEAHNKKTMLDKDVMNHVHAVPIEEEEALNGGYIFDVDDADRNPTQRCYVRNQGTDKTKMPDNIENSITDAQGQLNEDGTNRAQWTKCLPPPMYTLLSVESFAEGDIYNGRYEKRMRNATDFYATLKWMHNEACSHLRIRLENKVMLRDIREEVNWRAKKGMGFKIKSALDPIIKEIVRQYRSFDAKINPANAKTKNLLAEALGPLKQALRVAKHSAMITLENGEGRRRNDAQKSARELLDPLYNNVMDFDMDKFASFMESRPDALDDMMTGDNKQRMGLGNPEVGSDGLPDSLKNMGRCGKPLFDFAGYFLWTITISHDQSGSITILTKKGWKKPEEVVADAMYKPLRSVLPPDAYEVETKTTSYQDDLFASGNLACGDRVDGLWTLTSYDRDSNENKVTATREEGYFCIWMLNDLLVLPENQRAGFSNTEFIAESPQEMARVMNGEIDNYKKYFPKPGEKYKYYHCHYSPRNSGSARVHSFQHQAERHYPGGIRQYCNCDWRRIGMIVSRCDCTLDAKANGGCRRVEMEMLNEHTQHDLWQMPDMHKNKKTPSRIVSVHGALAEGKITSHTYQNNRRRREPDNENIFQEDTGRVRPTTNGNGGNNVVCSVNEAGVPDGGNFARRADKQITAKSTIDPNIKNCKETQGLREEVFYFNQGTQLQTFNGRTPSLQRVVPMINYANSATAWSGMAVQQQFAIRWWGDMLLPKSDNYKVSLNCDDGCRFFVDHEQRVDNNHYNSFREHNQVVHFDGRRYQIRIEYFQRIGWAGMQFKLHFSNGTEVDYKKVLKATCGFVAPGGAAMVRSFFTDLNKDGKMSYPECRRRRTVNRRRGAPSVEECNGEGKEFPLRDIYASAKVSSPAGGINHEFVDKSGESCDILKFDKNKCTPADAGRLYQRPLADFLAKFCDVPAALYQIPVNASGVVPEDFGAIASNSAMPMRAYNAKYINYRAEARADFASLGKGTFLFCQKDDKKCEGNKPMAVQGVFRGIEDERVWSSDSSNVLKARFFPTIGGSTAGNVPSSVHTKWTQAGSTASGIFNNDVLARYRRSTNEGTMYAKDRVKMDQTRSEGVTCLNGKYVYARMMPDGSRPVVSTVREGFNRHGPVATNAKWACRYVGVHCNANNCNNNGNTEVAGPFVEPLIKAKREKPKEEAPTKPRPNRPDRPTKKKTKKPGQKTGTTSRRRLRRASRRRRSGGGSKTRRRRRRGGSRRRRRSKVL